MIPLIHSSIVSQKPTQNPKMHSQKTTYNDPEIGPSASLAPSEAEEVK
jgi:hypothetical protein